MAWKIIWWIPLVVLITTVCFAWSFEHKISTLQAAALYELGEDIVANPKKWDEATLRERKAFFWWKDLDVGHGLTMQIVNLKQLAFLGITLQLALTVASMKRTSNCSKAQQGQSTRTPTPNRCR